MQHIQPTTAFQPLPLWRDPAPCSCDEVIALVSHHKRVPIRVLTHRSRGHIGAARARQLAMYLSHIVFGRTLTDIGLAFGRDRTTVSYACALIEDMRDDPGFDEEVSALEKQLEQAAGAREQVHAA